MPKLDKIARKRKKAPSLGGTTRASRLYLATRQSVIVVRLVEPEADAGEQILPNGDPGFVAAVKLPSRVALGRGPGAIIDHEVGPHVVSIHDLQRSGDVCKQGLRYLLFYFPLATLQLIAADSGYTFGCDLGGKPFVDVADDTLWRLAASLEPSLSRVQEATQFFVDNVAHAAAMHFVALFGLKKTASAPVGGLAPWQQKRAREMLEADLHGSMPLAEIAAQCRLSTRHFSRAFKQSMGMPPQRWLIKCRVEAAKQLMCDPDLCLAEVAKRSGFADQSHLTRVFSDWFGESPGSWRRANMRPPRTGDP